MLFNKCYVILKRNTVGFLYFLNNIPFVSKLYTIIMQTSGLSLNYTPTEVKIHAFD